MTLVYDEAANYDGQSARHRRERRSARIRKMASRFRSTPGPAAKIKVSFDDSIRWK